MINELLKELEEEKDNYNSKRNKEILYTESDIYNIYGNIIRRLKRINIR